MRINHDNLTNQANQPLYQQATCDVPAKTYVVETKKGQIEILVDPGIWEKIKHRKFSTNNDGYVYVSKNRAENLLFGRKARSTLSLHTFVMATITGRFPTDWIDHLHHVRDNRFNSLRLVTQSMNRVNGGRSDTKYPCVPSNPGTKNFYPDISIEGTRCRFGSYADRDVAWRAIQPALHYRSYLHALRSSWMMARHLAVATNAQTITELAQAYLGSWEPDSIGRLAYDYFCEVAIYGEPAIPAVPKDKLKSLCQLSAAGSTTAAVDAAKRLAYRSEYNAFVAMMQAELQQQLS